MAGLEMTSPSNKGLTFNSMSSPSGLQMSTYNPPTYIFGPQKPLNYTPQSGLQMGTPGLRVDSQPQSNVLGTQTQAPPQPTAQQRQSSGIQNMKNSNPAFQNYSDQALLDIMNQQNQLRGEISSGWDNYLSGLNGLMGSGLTDQRSAQENIAKSQYDQGVEAANTQRAKSLRDISGNIQNAFQAGNIYLGSRGAGDSSAANQYSFALNKEASRQTADLNEYTNTNLNSLKSTYDQQVNQIATWFADAQNQIKQMIAQGQLSKQQDIAGLSRDALNRALALQDQVRQNYEGRKSALMSWAMSNSQNIGQLQNNIASVAQSFGTPTVDSTGNYMVPIGYGATSNEQRPNNLFQNPSWFL